MRTRLHLGETLIRTVPAQLQSTSAGYGAWIDCAAAGRIAKKLLEGVRSAPDPKEAADDRLLLHLEGLLHVSSSFRIFVAGDRIQNDDLIMGTFDETSNFAFFGLFVGEDLADAQFYGSFGLTPDEAVLVKEATLGYIAAYIPRQDSGEPIRAVALMALGEDNWDYDAYKIPEQNPELYTRLVAEAKKALAAL